jgi:hypothetical protein
VSGTWNTSTNPVSCDSGYRVRSVGQCSILICERSILDCDPSEIEDPSDDKSGGVLPPELEVQVLECERAVGAGLVDTGTEQSRITS